MQRRREVEEGGGGHAKMTKGNNKTGSGRAEAANFPLEIDHKGSRGKGTVVGPVISPGEAAIRGGENGARGCGRACGG